MNSHDRERRIRKITLIGSIANLALMIFKFVAGVIGHSGAMIADAVHSLTDFSTDVIVLVLIRLSSKPKDEDHEYGHGKYETLATALIGGFLLAAGIGIMWSGASKIYGVMFEHRHIESPGTIALWAAIVSIVIKEILFRATIKVGRETDSQAVVANAWHHRSDSFSSIATTVGIAGAIFLGANWTILDPIAAIIVSILIVKASVSLIVPALNDLLEKSLPPETEREILKIITENDAVKDPHNLCTRRIGNDIAIEVHIRVDGDTSVNEAHELSREIERNLRSRFGQSTHIVLHVEPIKQSR